MFNYSVCKERKKVSCTVDNCGSTSYAIVYHELATRHRQKQSDLIILYSNVQGGDTLASMSNCEAAKVKEPKSENETDEMGYCVLL